MLRIFKKVRPIVGRVNQDQQKKSSRILVGLIFAPFIAAGFVLLGLAIAAYVIYACLVV